MHLLLLCCFTWAIVPGSTCVQKRRKKEMIGNCNMCFNHCGNYGIQGIVEPSWLLVTFEAVTGVGMRSAVELCPLAPAGISPGLLTPFFSFFFSHCLKLLSSQSSFPCYWLGLDESYGCLCLGKHQLKGEKSGNYSSLCMYHWSVTWLGKQSLFDA